MYLWKYAIVNYYGPFSHTYYMHVHVHVYLVNCIRHYYFATYSVVVYSEVW